MPDEHSDMPFDPDEQYSARIDALRQQLGEHLAILDRHATAALSTLRQLRTDEVFDIDFIEGASAAAFTHHLQTAHYAIAATRALNPDNHT